MSDILIPIEPAPDYNDRTQKYLMPPFQDITASEVMAEFEKRCGSGQQYTTFPNTISDDEKAKLEAAGYVVTANTIDSENIDGVEPTYIGFQVALNSTAAAKNMIIGQKGENGIGGGGGSTLIEKSISANGIYNASEDSADGYSKVTVDVPSGGGETFEVNILATETATVDKTYAEIKAAIESNKKISGIIDLLGAQTTNILNGCVHDIVHNGETQVANAIIIISEVFVPNWQSGTDSSVVYLIITPENTYSMDIVNITLH